MELPTEERLDYSACDADDLAALTAEVLPDEDWTIPENHCVRPPTEADVPEKSQEYIPVPDVAYDC
jgi:hypothetical protein